jgi:dienelactone hydrolase
MIWTIWRNETRRDRDPETRDERVAGATGGMRPMPIVDFWFPGQRGPALSRTVPRSVEPARGRRALAPAGRERFSLLLYFPGWPATAIDNVALIEELADSGFVVAAVRYPAVGLGMPRSVVARQRSELERPMDFSSAGAFAETLDRAERRVRDRASNAMAILDMIEGDGMLLDRVNEDRVGIFGYSLGGAVAAEACRRDARFRAAINLDGWHFGEALDWGVPRPYLFVGDGSPPPTASDLDSPDRVRRYTSRLNRKNHERLIANLAIHGGHLVTIDGSSHEHFADRRRWLDFGLLRGTTHARVREIVSRLAASFFAEHLKGEKSNLLRGALANDPDVRIQSWQPAKAGYAPAIL